MVHMLTVVEYVSPLVLVTHLSDAKWKILEELEPNALKCSVLKRIEDDPLSADPLHKGYIRDCLPAGTIQWMTWTRKFVKIQ